MAKLPAQVVTEVTEESLYEDIKAVLLNDSTPLTAHETPEGLCIFSWRTPCEVRYVLEAVWQDGGPHLTLFEGVADVDGIIASMADDWPDDPAASVLRAALEHRGQ